MCICVTSDTQVLKGKRYCHSRPVKGLRLNGIMPPCSMATGGAGGGVGLLGASFDLSAGFAFNLLSILCAGNSSELPPPAPAVSGDWLGLVRLGGGGEGGAVWKDVVGRSVGGRIERVLAPNPKLPPAVAGRGRPLYGPAPAPAGAG